MKIITMWVGILFTAYGAFLLFKGDTTNGLLSMILGEMIDLPKKNYFSNK